MYYAHLSKYDIMHSSRAFLYRIYVKYIARARENLGVTEKEETGPVESGTKAGTKTGTGYPEKFRKISPRERRQETEQYTDTQDFLSQFNGTTVYKNVKVNGEGKEGENGKSE